MNTVNRAGPAESSQKVKRQQAFTLIELMVTVAVIGILAAVAYPSYLQYVVRSNRVAAQAHLMNIAQREQQYLLDSRSYADKATLNVTEPANVTSVYTIAIDLGTASQPTFTARATPRSDKANANDLELTINQAGVKGPSGKW
jgi:type IV pilus assembly protein PilE